MNRSIGFNIAPPENPHAEPYTIAAPSAGIGSAYDDTADMPTFISLYIEPYFGDTQFLLEWHIDDEQMTPDQLLNALQGIRQVIETLKIEDGRAISNLKIVINDGYHADKQARSVRLAAIQAFEAALEAAHWVKVSEVAPNFL